MTTTLQAAGKHVYAATLVPSALVAGTGVVTLAGIRATAPRSLAGMTNAYGQTVMTWDVIAKQGSISTDALKMSKIGGAAAALHGVFNLVALDKEKISQAGSIAEIVGGAGLLTNVGAHCPRLAIAFGSLALAGAAANVVSGIKMDRGTKTCASGAIVGAGVGLAVTSKSCSIPTRLLGAMMGGVLGAAFGTMSAESK